MNILQVKKNHVYVGRAASAIYLILQAEHIKNKKILYPANICYAAVYPAIYADNYPVFCDVNGEDGNVTYKIVEQYINEVAVMVLPHMYGNPIQEIQKIRELCNRTGIILIEDCASAMGADVHDSLCGSWGDYTIFSTGYSKTLDLGIGGILLTDRDTREIEQYNKQLPLWDESIENDENFFSRLYRLIRNNKRQDLSKYIWQGFYNNLQKLFIYQYPKINEKIENAVLNLDSIVNERREQVLLYQKNIKSCSIWKEYKFHDGAVPWRYCLFVEKEEKKPLIEYLLKKDIPVSDWYPVVTPIFGQQDINIFECAKNMEDRMINFPLLIERTEIDRICEVLNEYISKNIVME